MDCGGLADQALSEADWGHVKNFPSTFHLYKSSSSIFCTVPSAPAICESLYHRELREVPLHRSKPAEMEALGAAASVVSLATILAQLIDGVTQLHGFWTSVKEVPKSLTWLSTDLEILHDILQSIESSSVQLSQTGDTSPLSGILQKCALYIEYLQETVKPLQSEARDKPVKKAWRSVKAVFDSKKIKSYRENLESAKATLLLAQNQLH